MGMNLDINNLTCEQVAILERNIAVKNMAKRIVAGFKKNVLLNLEAKKGLEFRIWSDNHNAEYVEISEKGIAYRADFLHENYYVQIDENAIYDGILSSSRGIQHVASNAKIHDYNPNNYKLASNDFK